MRYRIGEAPGDPARAICSTLIAQAFQSVSYPILPYIEESADRATAGVHRVRHHTLFAPRDFDITPYFRIIKPTLEAGFDHHQLAWAENSPGSDPV